MPYNPNYWGKSNSSSNNFFNGINKFTYTSRITNNKVVLTLSPGIKWGVPTFGIKFRF